MPHVVIVSTGYCCTKQFFFGTIFIPCDFVLVVLYKQGEFL